MSEIEIQDYFDVEDEEVEEFKEDLGRFVEDKCREWIDEAYGLDPFSSKCVRAFASWLIDQLHPQYVHNDRAENLSPESGFELRDLKS